MFTNLANGLTKTLFAFLGFLAFGQLASSASAMCVYNIIQETFEVEFACDFGCTIFWSVEYGGQYCAPPTSGTVTARLGSFPPSSVEVSDPQGFAVIRQFSGQGPEICSYWSDQKSEECVPLRTD